MLPKQTVSPFPSGIEFPRGGLRVPLRSRAHHTQVSRPTGAFQAVPGRAAPPLPPPTPLPIWEPSCWHHDPPLPPSPNPPLSLCHRAPDKPRGLRGVCAVKQTPCGALAPVGLLPRGMASTCRTPLAEARSCLEALHGLCSLLQGRASVARPGSGPHHAVTSALPQ